MPVTLPMRAMDSTSDASPRPWTLRYAGHLGFRSPDLPLFRRLVSSNQVQDHVRFSARIGFAGIQYALARSRPIAEQLEVAATATECGLEVGCVVYATFETIRRLYPGSLGNPVASEFRGEVERGLETAVRLGSRSLAVLASLDPVADPAQQLDTFTERLLEATTLAGHAGVRLLLEPLSSPVLPVQLLRSLDEAISLIDAVSSPALGLIFDTAHVQAKEGAAALEFERVYPYVALLQLADAPGRLEPGTGNVDFARLLRAAAARGFRGLIELEHHWADDTAAAESRGLAYLKALDEPLVRGE
jgi:hydroxypyruvate isomerase